MGDSNLYVNPELPPEMANIQNEDLIGDTLFGKHDLFEILLLLIKKIEEQSSSGKTNGNGHHHHSDDDEAMSELKELDADLEKKLCDLWDITVEKDVCQCLNEYNALQIFEGYMRKFDGIYPRAVEILIGIMGNMVMTSVDISMKLIENREFIHYLLFNVFVSMTDVQTVIQVTQLMSLLLTDWNEQNNEEEDEKDKSEEFQPRRKLVKEKFIAILKSIQMENHDEAEINMSWQILIEKFFFILEQSLNSSLLDSTISFIFNLLDNDDQMLNVLASNSRLVDAICLAALTRLRLDNAEKSVITSQYTQINQRSDQTPVPRFHSQLSQDDILTTDHIFNKFFMCLQTLSTCEMGAASLLAGCDSVFQLYDEYLERCLSTFNDWEIKSSRSLKSSVGEESIQNLLCLLSVLNCLFPVRESIDCDDEAANNSQLRRLHVRFSKFFQKFFTLCNYYLSMFQEFVNKTGNAESSSSSTLAEALEHNLSSMNNFNLAKTYMKDLFFNLEELKSENDANLNRIFESCTQLLNENN